MHQPGLPATNREVGASHAWTFQRKVLAWCAGAGANSSSNPCGGTIVYYDDGDEALTSNFGDVRKDAVDPLNARALEEARLQGWDTRSLDLGHEPKIHGGTLYQLLALLFARSCIESLCVPAPLESRQVYAGVAIPTLRICRYAEHPDILGALEAFAGTVAHAGVHTLKLTDGTELPIGLGRLHGRNRTPLKDFLDQLRHLQTSGRSRALPGEAGTQRHLLHFIAPMNRLRTLNDHGYVPGMPCFQVLCVLNTTLDAALEELIISLPSLEGSTPHEDRHLYKTSAVPSIIELVIHAPGAVKPRDAHEACTALLTAATNLHGLQRLHATLTTWELESRTEEAVVNARRYIPDIVLGEREKIAMIPTSK